jgi:hypothetical protein
MPGAQFDGMADLLDADAVNGAASRVGVMISLTCMVEFLAKS